MHLLIVESMAICKNSKKIPQYLQNSLLVIRFLFEVFYTVIKAAQVSPLINFVGTDIRLSL